MDMHVLPVMKGVPKRDLAFHGEIGDNLPQDRLGEILAKTIQFVRHETGDNPELYTFAVTFTNS